jgi:hypothetical protein
LRRAATLKTSDLVPAGLLHPPANPAVRRRRATHQRISSDGHSASERSPSRRPTWPTPQSSPPLRTSPRQLQARHRLFAHIRRVLEINELHTARQRRLSRAAAIRGGLLNVLSHPCEWVATFAVAADETAADVPSNRVH